jgi:hypothetical protein
VGLSSLDGRLSKESPFLHVCSPSNDTARQRRQFLHLTPRYATQFADKCLVVGRPGRMPWLPQCGRCWWDLELVCYAKIFVDNSDRFMCFRGLAKSGRTDEDKRGSLKVGCLLWKAQEQELDTA